jgi:hypothetical protein
MTASAEVRTWFIFGDQVWRRQPGIEVCRVVVREPQDHLRRIFSDVNGLEHLVAPQEFEFPALGASAFAARKGDLDLSPGAVGADHCAVLNHFAQGRKSIPKSDVPLGPERGLGVIAVGAVAQQHDAFVDVGSRGKHPSGQRESSFEVCGSVRRRQRHECGAHRIEIAGGR